VPPIVGSNPPLFLFKTMLFTETAVQKHDTSKVKVKITLNQATKAQRGSRSVAVFFL